MSVTRRWCHVEESPARRRALWALSGAVVALYLALATFVNVRTGAWENNDEAHHVAVAEYMLRTGHRPPVTGQSGEAHQAPLYYVLLAGWQKLNGIPAFDPRPVASSDPAPVTSRALVLSHDYTPQQHREAVWLHRLRILSELCGAIAVAAAFWTGWLVTGTHVGAAAVGATVATWPKLLVVTAAVTNSALVEALLALLVPVTIVWWRRRTLGHAALVGATGGLAIMAQVTAAPAVALILVAVAWASLRRRQVLPPVVAGLTCLLMAAWWFIRNVQVYGDLTADAATRTALTNVFGPTILREPPGFTWHRLVESFHVLRRSFWYDGGWNQLHLPAWMDAVLGVMAVGCFLALIVRRGRELLPAVLCAAGGVLAWLLIIREYTQAEGRYLLIAGSSWSLLLVLGAKHLASGRSLGLWVWPAAFLCVDAYVAVEWLIPYGTT
jgi:hypothetical protein